MHAKYELSTSYHSKVMAKVKVLSQPRSLGQNFLHDWKVLIIRNVHMKYESSTCNGSKDMAKVRPKVIRNVGQRSRSRSFDIGAI